MLSRVLFKGKGLGFDIHKQSIVISCQLSRLSIIIISMMADIVHGVVSVMVAL